MVMRYAGGELVLFHMVFGKLRLMFLDRADPMLIKNELNKDNIKNK